jgi:DNA helicase-4
LREDAEGVDVGTLDRGWGREQGPADQRWRVELHPDGFHLSAQGAQGQFAGTDAEQLRPVRRWFRSIIEVQVAGSQLRLRGLGRSQAGELDRAITTYLARHRAAEPVEQALAWRHLVDTTLTSWRERRRWIPNECVLELLREKPTVDPRTWFEGPDAVHFVASLTEEETAALTLLHQDLEARVREVNESILAAELRDRRAFFDNVEASPLTEEQARAVVSYDNRVQVIASAGSGKTSVMVARAAYAIDRGFAAPEQILLLAFNKAAATELQERVNQRLSALGLDSQGLRASTFHAFGLDVIGRATGRKPRPAPWLDNGQDVAMVSRIVDELRDSSPDFRFRWDLFRLLYARVSDDPEAKEYDGWDPDRRQPGFNTFHGEVVKSEGERMIADWLYLNGVDYRYEQPYVHDVASESHSQYRPDFYYPDVEVWHEHWAIGHDGKPPDSFAGYADAMKWKQELHRKHGTTLVETRWAEIIDGRGFESLAQTLKKVGLELDWNPDRPTPGVQPPKHEDLARLVRTFMTHVKSNGWTREQLTSRQPVGGATPNNTRNNLFLELYWQIHDAWQARLAAEDCVDFEDMLVRAAEHLERGEATYGYTLVMVDEFQDVSQARARLTRALVSDPARHLLTVGDDWQSINRFAGADLSVMTRFDSWFGRGLQLRLQTTFRCPQSICDVSSAFVTKNPRQLRKSVRSAAEGYGPPVKVLYVEEDGEISGAIGHHLDDLQGKLETGVIAPGRLGRLSVDVLGRYNFDRKHLPARRRSGIDLTFRTVHGSKGLEADYVVIPNLTRGVFGFPSQIADDPVLDLVMSEPDPYPHAEERRLFYVALTRARREVVLVAVRGKESTFLRELVDDGLVTVMGGEDVAAPPVCPQCEDGFLVARRGPYGAFLGCSTFPRCRHTAKVSA